MPKGRVTQAGDRAAGAYTTALVVTLIIANSGMDLRTGVPTLSPGAKLAAKRVSQASSTSQCPQQSQRMPAVGLSVLQRADDLVVVEEDAGLRCFRAQEFEGAWQRSFRKEAFSYTQEDRVDDQQDFVHKPMFE